MRNLAFGVTLAIACAGAFAQAAPAASTPRVDHRETLQEKRIEHGVESGSLTAREATRLEKRQALVGKAEDQAKSDGTVTTRERARLHRMQKRGSHGIARQSHDAQTEGSSAKP